MKPIKLELDPDIRISLANRVWNWISIYQFLDYWEYIAFKIDILPDEKVYTQIEIETNNGLKRV